MDHYQCSVISNTFRVKDMGRFQELAEDLSSEYGLETETDDGAGTVRIKSYAQLDYLGDEEWLIDGFYRELSKIMEENSAAIFIEAGADGIRFLNASAVIVTTKGIEYLDLEEIATRRAAEILGIPQNELSETPLDLDERE